MTNIYDLRIARFAKEARVTHNELLLLMYDYRMFTEVERYIDYYDLWGVVYSANNSRAATCISKDVDRGPYKTR